MNGIKNAEMKSWISSAFGDSTNELAVVSNPKKSKLKTVSIVKQRTAIKGILIKIAGTLLLYLNFYFQKRDIEMSIFNVKILKL